MQEHGSRWAGREKVIGIDGGPFLSERAWGTVREDYSPDSEAWNYFPHDHARSRAYRWNEDGLAGICDRHQYLCFAVALWNGRDPYLKERMFGLAGPEGNHGEDVKEYYFYLDNTPTHSYMKFVYKYPQAEFPYAQLVEENRRRDKLQPEYELVATGIFEQGRYFDVVVEYAKVEAEDMLIRISISTAATRKWMEAGPPDAPAWLAKIQVVGQPATERWQSLASDSTRLLQEMQRSIQPASAWLLSAGLKLTGGLVQLAMSILISFFLYRDGSSLAERLKSGVHRIASERGQRLLELAGNTVRSVVYGILGTALVQGVMAGVGFLIADVPGAALLALLTFFLSIVPMGPPLVWIPATIWLFQQGHTGWGIFMLVWGVGVSSGDNVVKPWLISHGSDMPFILIMFGILGGALAFGFIGVFLGPLCWRWAIASSRNGSRHPARLERIPLHPLSKFDWEHDYECQQRADGPAS